METGTLGSDVDDARERFFVGRESELERLDALCRDSGPCVAYVHGPGGVGKSEMLQVFGRRWQRLGAGVATLDARSIVANEQGLSDGVQAAKHGLGQPCDLLIIDSIDHVWHLERWLRESYLPSLPLSSRVVLSGRDPLDAAWLASPAWRSRLDSIVLANLSEQETCAYLERAGVPARNHRAVYQTSFGHPLTTALLAEIGLHSEDDLPHLGQLPDLVQTVLSHLLRQVLDEAQRLALWCAALVPALTEELLSRMIPNDFQPALFDWVRARSFVATTENGLVLHDLARAALAADAQWRAPDVRRRLVERALDAYLQGMEVPGMSVIENGRSVVSTMQLYGNHLLLGARRDYYPSTLEPGDWPKLEEMVTRHEGKEAGALASFWHDRGAEIMVVRGRDGEPAGGVITLWLDQVDRQDAAQDQGVLPLFNHLEKMDALHDGRIYFVRFWMGRDSYQSFNSPVAGVLITRILTHAFVDGMAFAFSAHGDPQSVLAVQSSLESYEDCGFEIGDRSYQVMGHDFRRDRPARWFRRILTSTIRETPARTLDRETFENAVRSALRFIRQLDKLAGNPLLRSRLVADVSPDATGPVAAERLQALLQSEIDGLEADARETDAHDVLTVTYLGRPIKQATAAAELGMSYSTYRRRHALAVARLTDILWQRDGTTTPEDEVSE